MELLSYFFNILLYSVGPLIVCGILVYILNKLYTLFMGDNQKLLIASSYLGTPIHEIGHLIMCLLFFHKVTEVKLYTKGEDGTLGYIKHKFNKKNFYQQVGNLFIGLGPIFSGLLVIIGILYFFFNSVIVEYFSTCFIQIDSGVGVLTSVSVNLMDLFLSLIYANTHIALKLISIIIILSISLHINLSIPDIKSGLIGLFYYSIVALLFSMITFKMQIAVTIIEKLKYFSSVAIMLFSIVIIFAIINVLLAFIIFLVRKFVEN